MAQAGEVKLSIDRSDVAEQRRQHRDIIKMEAAKIIALDRIAIRLVALVIAVCGLILVTAVDADAHFYSGCKTAECKWHVIKPHNESLKRVAQCESGKDWDYNGSSGFDGGLQFSPRTWSGLGSRYAYAWQAPRKEQKYRAIILLSRNGWRWVCTCTWPHCGKYA